MFVERGSGWLETPVTKKIPIAAPCLIYLFPGLVHSYAADDWWCEHWIEFAGPMAESFEESGFFERRRPLLPLHDDREIPEQFSRVHAALREPHLLAGSLAAARLHELLVLAHGLRTGLRRASSDLRDRSSEESSEDGFDPIVHRAIDWIRDRATREMEAAGRGRGALSASGRLELRPEDVAAELEIGYSTLRKRFKQATGFSIKEYILSLQLRRAKELLIYSSNPVEEIALRVGFADPFYFSRLFRSREGASPSEFRERRERGPVQVALVRRGRTADVAR